MCPSFPLPSMSRSLETPKNEIRAVVNNYLIFCTFLKKKKLAKFMRFDSSLQGLNSVIQVLNS